MRNLTYKLADDSIVKSYKDAIASNQPFTAVLETVDRPKAYLSPKRKAMLERFGFVSSELKDLV